MNEKNYAFKITQKIFKFTTALTIIFGIANCTEDIKEELRPLGPEARAEEIEKVLEEATSGTHIYYTKPNEYVHYEENYRLELSPVVKFADTLRTYVGMTETDEKMVFHLNESAFSYDKNGSITDEKHGEVNLTMSKGEKENFNLKSFSFNSSIAEKVITLKNYLNFSSDSESKGRCGSVVYEDSSGDKYDCIRYFNFNRYERNEPVPQRAMNRPQCSGVPHCALPATILEFDQVKFLNGKFVKKEVFKVAFSKVVPDVFPDYGIPPIVYFCITQALNVGGPTYNLNKCTVLRDLVIVN